MPVGLLEGPLMLVDAANEGSAARNQMSHAPATLLSIQEEGAMSSALQQGAVDALGFSKDQQQSSDVHAHVMRPLSAAQQQHSSAASSTAAATLSAAPRFAGPAFACTPVLQHIAGRGTCALLRVPLNLKPGTILAGFSPSPAHGGNDSDNTDLRILAHSHGQYLRTVVLPRSAEKGEDVDTFTEFEVGCQ
jgi:hypothetical protein